MRTGDRATPSVLADALLFTLLFLALHIGNFARGVAEPVLAGLVVISGLRWRRGASTIAARPAWIAVLGMAGFILLWVFALPWLWPAAGAVRAALPFKLENLFRAMPGNDPAWAARLLAGERLVDLWSAIYLAGYVVTPVLTIAWLAARGDGEAAATLSGVHLISGLIAAPFFIVLPVPDPWYGVGWFGAASPPWWAGISDQVITCAFPSLHVAVATATALVAYRAQPALGVRVAWILWASLVTVSTLALRTHWLVDLPAGAALGFAAVRVARTLVARLSAGRLPESAGLLPES